MNEGFRNLALLVWALCAVNSNSYASDNKIVIAEEMTQESPTIVYGAAKKADGEVDEVVVEQPQNGPNPLGNPIVIPEKYEAQAKVATPEGKRFSASSPQSTGNEEAPNPQALGKDFQNTLLEANGMVYDVQAYPEKDLKAIGNPSEPATIYSPNVNP